jgi:hypothetical protein
MNVFRHVSNPANAQLKRIRARGRGTDRDGALADSKDGHLNELSGVVPERPTPNEAHGVEVLKGG